MASGDLPTSASLHRKHHVQEGGGDGGGLVPEKYIYKNAACGDPAFDASLPRMDCPPIDLKLLVSSSESELLKFRSALTTWGCLQIVNHGISSATLDEMHRTMKQFFELPLEEKQRYSRTINDIEGYGNDTFVSENHVYDWTNRLTIVTYPVEKRRLQFWPEKPDYFRANLHQFTLKVQEILILVLKVAARSLGVEDESFLKQYGENGMIITRLSIYPRCPLPDRVLGFHPHTDGSAITIILQDNQVEGLQVLKDDQWFNVPINVDSLFINIGDQLEIMSNGIFRSPTHRVVTSADNERLSLVMFCMPESENEIEPLEELITEDRPQMYMKVKNYLEIFFKHYELGESPLSTVKMHV